METCNVVPADSFHVPKHRRHALVVSQIVIAYVRVAYIDAGHDARITNLIDDALDLLEAPMAPVLATASFISADVYHVLQSKANMGLLLQYSSETLSDTDDGCIDVSHYHTLGSLLLKRAQATISRSPAD